ncbi:MAG: O-antigen ligase family protein, partial [Armatimonadota bacterium]
MRAVNRCILKARTLRLTGWEIVIYLVLFIYIVSPFHPHLWYVFPGIHQGFRTATVDFFGNDLYFLNYVILAVLVLSLLLLVYYRMLKRSSRGGPYVVFLFSALFALMYLLDFFLSRAPVYEYATLSILLLPLIIWLFILLIADQQTALRLLKATALFVAIQSVYGIVYYATGTEQFYTPRFGARTAGTLESPNNLYVVALMGVPLLWCLAKGSSSNWERKLWYAGLVTTFSALIFTYTRTGWLAVVPVLLWLAFHPYSCVSTKSSKYIVVSICTLLLIATVFVRTGGNYLGNPSDRSFHGRFAIWRVAWKVCFLHPWIGNGLNTYPWLQRQMMTADLESFGPGNEEAKNLFLNLFAELGAVGLVLFLMTIFSYIALINFQLSKMEHNLFKYAVTGCYMAVVSVLLASFGDTPILHFKRLAPTLVFAVTIAVGTVIAVQHHSVPTPCPHRNPITFSIPRVFRRLPLALMLLLPILLLLYPFSGYLQFLHHRISIPAYRTLIPNLPRFTPLAEVAPAMKDALIASEDGYFLQHHGVDWQA